MYQVEKGKTMFQVEKNVPFPPKRVGVSIYPFAQMRKGDSFLIPAKTKEEKQARRKAVTAAAYKWKVKITARVVDDGVRVWRL